jgi:hypothetical protein
LTDLEREAILGDDWPGLAEQQTRKAQLQAEIQSALKLAHATPSAQGQGSLSLERAFEPVVGELMALERRNGELLAEKRTRRQGEADRLAGTLHDLHGVRRAYGSSQGARWQSYS